MEDLKKLPKIKKSESLQGIKQTEEKIKFPDIKQKKQNIDK
jgi:hypothetical protein